MKLYQVDAFNNELFSGNPAAVIPLDTWISDDLMQNIAEENNLSETVFFVPHGEGYEIRWFTPANEIDLCGHATLAAAHILYSELKFTKTELLFHSKSGELRVTKNGSWYTLNFPSEEIQEVAVPDSLESALGSKVQACFKGKWKLVALLENEHIVAGLKPDFGMISKLEAPGIIVTAPGKQVDFVSRFFAPQLGINEDPVTGSAHTLLIPYWAKELNKKKLKAMQISKRKGILNCTYLKDRVEMSGQAITYLIGNINIRN